MTVTEKIGAGLYETKLPYGSGVPSRMRKQGLLDEAGALQQQREAHRADVRRLEIEFRDDLAREHGVLKHEREPKLFDCAWEFGHEAGLHEVVYFYEKLVELIK